MNDTFDLDSPTSNASRSVDCPRSLPRSQRAGGPNFYRSSQNNQTPSIPFNFSSSSQSPVNQSTTTPQGRTPSRQLTLQESFQAAASAESIIVDETPDAPLSKRARALDFSEDSAAQTAPQRPRPRLGIISLSSVQSALADIDAAADAAMTNALRQGIFLNCHLNHLACFLYDQSTHLVDLDALCQCLAFQVAYISMGRFNSFRIPPVDIAKCLEHLQRAQPHLNIDVAAALESLEQHRMMLWEYWRIKISEQAPFCLEELPFLFPKFIPCLPAVGNLLYDLTHTVDFSAEEACFHSMASALAAFYTLDPTFMHPHFPSLSSRYRLFIQTSLSDRHLDRARSAFLQSSSQDHLFALTLDRSSEVTYLVASPDQMKAELERDPRLTISEVLLPDNPVFFYCPIFFEPFKFDANSSLQTPHSWSQALTILKTHVVTQWCFDTHASTQDLSDDWILLMAVDAAPNQVCFRLIHPKMLFHSPKHLLTFISRCIHRVQQDVLSCSKLMVARTLDSTVLDTIIDPRELTDLSLVRLPFVSSSASHPALVPVDSSSFEPISIPLDQLLLSVHRPTESTGFQYPAEYESPVSMKIKQIPPISFHTPSSYPAELQKIVLHSILPALKDPALRLVIPKDVNWIKIVPIFPSLKNDCK